MDLDMLASYGMWLRIHALRIMVLKFAKKESMKTHVLEYT